VTLNIVDDAVQGVSSARFGAVVSAILLLVTGLAYTLALRPRVVVSGDGITVVNPYRTHRVPWRRITTVDTGEWVQVHYAPAGGESAGGPGPASPDSAPASSADSLTLRCWALYVSTRARRKIAAPPRPRPARGLAGFGLGRAGWGSAPAGDYTSPKLPEEARYLASLPPAKAMAVRLDTRADRERTRAENDAYFGRPRAAVPAAVSAWSWLALVAVIVPAVILIAVIAAA
jgi:hypothetical protein